MIIRAGRQAVQPLSACVILISRVRMALRVPCIQVADEASAVGFGCVVVRIGFGRFAEEPLPAPPLFGAAVPPGLSVAAKPETGVTRISTAMAMKKAMVSKLPYRIRYSKVIRTDRAARMTVFRRSSSETEISCGPEESRLDVRVKRSGLLVPSVDMVLPFSDHW